MKEKINILNKKDLVISYFRGSGDGGQNLQKTSSGVNISHPESGATGRCSEGRSQWQNKKAAFKRLCEHPKMKLWIAKRIFEIQSKKTVEQIVEEQMAPENLEVQGRDENGNWVTI